MYDHTKLSQRLRENILAVLAGSCTRAQVNSLVAVCHAFASSFLASKRTIIQLMNKYQLNTSDIAYDCIAELFQQDDANCYVQLHAYFSALPVTTVDEAELLALLRRLVFSKVNHGIYRLYSEFDPSLAKILRNAKLAIQSLKNFTEIERFGEQCIAPLLCDALEHLPIIDHTELERELVQRTTGNENVPEILAAIARYLREQNDYARVIPLVTVGVTIRSVYTMKHSPSVDASTMDENLLVQDASAIIRTVCDDVRRQNEKKYVKQAKVELITFKSYFKVIEEGLSAKYIDRDGVDFSLYESLRKHVTDLSKETYTADHRSRLEYLFKLAQLEARKQLKKM